VRYGAAALEDEVFKLSSGGTELVAPDGISGRDPAVIDLIDQVDLEGLRFMNGLRMFILNTSAVTAGGLQVFYSRRDDGPYYRWWYDHGLEHWRAARVQGHEFPTAPLCSSSWKSIPVALQGSLIDHYQD